MADAPGSPLTAVPTPAGLFPRVLQSWWAPRRVVAGLADMPERALLMVLMAALLLFLLAQFPVHSRAAALDPSIPLDARMVGATMAVMFLMPLVAYAVAGLVSALSRLTPHPLQPRHSRLALFWAMLAASPAMLLAGLVEGSVGPGLALSLTRSAAGLGFAVIWGGGILALSRR